MVQIKQLSKGKNSLAKKSGKQSLVKPQLHFSSSDEEEDSEVEVDGDEAEDEDLFDEELEDEELEGEDMEDEEDLEDEDDEEEEVAEKIPTKAELAAIAMANKKGAQKQSAKTPTKGEQAKKTPNKGEQAKKTPVKGEQGKKTPTKPESVQKKTNGVTKDDGKSLKRKAEESTPMKTPAKQSRLNDQFNIVDEETRRREERNKRSLFLKGVGKIVRKPSEIKGLHPDIISVRTMGVNAWALFPSETSCTKAHKLLEAKVMNGKKLTVDYCGDKAANKAESNKNLDKPINKLALLVSGLPTGTTAEKLKVIFPTAKAVELPKSSKKNTTAVAFVHFASEAEAQASFVKHESLKVGGAPVEVLYARQRFDSSKKN